MTQEFGPLVWNLLFSADSIDEMIKGRTNAPRAVHEGWTDKARLSRMLEEVRATRKERTLWRDGYDPLSYSDWPMAVLNIRPNSREADYLILYYFPRRAVRYEFSDSGKLLDFRKYTVSGEIQDTLQQHVKSNLTYVDDVASKVKVYLESSETVARSLNMGVKLLDLPGPEQFLHANSCKALQVLAAYSGANGLVSCQGSPPSSGTPVMIGNSAYPGQDLAKGGAACLGHRQI